MPQSILLHLHGAEDESTVIERGVEMARRAEARVRGLTLLDTRRLMSTVSTCEAAICTNGEFRRLDRVERQHGKMRARLSQACLSAGVDFDLRRVRGDPFELLPPESQFHDLVVTNCSLPDAAEDDAGLTPDELIDLLCRGVRPMLVLRGRQQPLSRVLLVYDGSPATGGAVRTFLQQNLLPDAECRLLAIGPDEDRARLALREMADCCRIRRRAIETGSLCGPLRRVLIPYALQWEADLIVLGVARGNPMLRRLLGEPARDVLRKTGCALYATS
jgi:nucleotide-binding universal stress UspA family protein